MPIPNRPALRGYEFFNQAVFIDRNANQLGVIVTNAGRGVIG